MTDNYDDIIHLPRHVSKRHPQMSLYNRAAQFAPFAALTGYGAAIAETARQTSPKIEMMEDDRQLMDRKLSILSSHLEEEPTISITFSSPMDVRQVDIILRLLALSRLFVPMNESL